MRRSSVLFLFSALAPSGACLVGCFGDNGSNSQDAGNVTFDSSTGDVSVPQPDSGQPQETGPQPEAGPLPEASVEAEAGSPSGVLPPKVDFQQVGCGAPAVTQTFTVQNTGPVPVTYSAAISGSSVFAISGPSSGSVAPGLSGSITLTATVPATATAGQAITGSITVTTNVPGFETVTIPLSVTPKGGTLTITPALAGFGQAQVSTPAPSIPLQITNTGNAPIDVALGTPTDAEFTVGYTGSPFAITLAPGASLSSASAGFTPTSVGDKTATAAVKVTGTLCGTAAPLALSGTGTTANITVGPSPIDFGTVTCGAPAPKSQAVTITNAGTTAVTYTAALGKGGSSPFKLDAPTGTIPANGKAVINVSPNPIALPASVAANAYGDTLTVTPNAPGVSPSTVTLLQSASGAIVAINMPTTDFGLVPINTQASLPFTIVNTGNVDATAVSVTTVGSFWTSSLVGNKATANGGSVPGTVGFKTANTTQSQTTLAATTTAPLCAPIAPVTVTGQGESAIAGVTGAGFVVQNTCGVNSSTQATITVTNTGATGLTLSNVVTTSPRLQIVSAPTGFIQPGQSGQIVVQARNPIIGTDAAGTYSVAVRFTTNEVGSPTKQVGGSVVIHGANLVLSTNPINLNSAQYYQCFPGTQYDIANTGDLAGSVVGTGNYPFGFNDISFSGAFSSAVTIQPGSSVFDGVDANGIACTETDQVTFSAATSPTNPVCVPPAVLTVNVNVPLFSGSGGQTFCDCQPFSGIGTPENLP